MKRILTIASGCLLLLMSACAPNPEKIAEKIENGEPLTETEYTEACNYSLRVVEQIGDSVEAHKGNFVAIVKSLRSINDENPYANVIVESLIAGDLSSLSDENRRLHDKLMKNLEGVMETIGREGPVIKRDLTPPASEAPSDTDAAPAPVKMENDNP